MYMEKSSNGGRCSDSHNGPTKDESRNHLILASPSPHNHHLPHQIKLSNLELLCLPIENLHLFNRSWLQPAVTERKTLEDMHWVVWRRAFDQRWRTEGGLILDQASFGCSDLYTEGNNGQADTTNTLHLLKHAQTLPHSGVTRIYLGGCTASVFRVSV